MLLSILSWSETAPLTLLSFVVTGVGLIQIHLLFEYNLQG